MCGVTHSTRSTRPRCSVDLLAALGYEVIASTGKAEAHDYLMGLGAYQVVGRLLSACKRLPVLEPKSPTQIEFVSSA